MSLSSTFQTPANKGGKRAQQPSEKYPLGGDSEHCLCPCRQLVQAQRGPVSPGLRVCLQAAVLSAGGQLPPPPSRLMSRHLQVAMAGLSSVFCSRRLSVDPHPDWKKVRYTCFPIAPDLLRQGDHGWSRRTAPPTDTGSPLPGLWTPQTCSRSRSRYLSGSRRSVPARTRGSR